MRDIRKQWKRNHVAFDVADDDIPVFPTIASQFNDPGVSWMFKELFRRVVDKAGLDETIWSPEINTDNKEPRSTAAIPGARIRYLAEIAEQGRAANKEVDSQATIASRAQHVFESLKLLEDPNLPGELELYKTEQLTEGEDRSLTVLRQRYQESISDLSSESIRLLQEWPARKAGVKSEQYSYTVRGREITGNNYLESLSHQRHPKDRGTHLHGLG